MSSGGGLHPGIDQGAQFPGIPLPSKMAPIIPMRAEVAQHITLSWLFTSVNTFCMRSIALPASATRLPLCRHRVDAIRISSLG